MNQQVYLLSATVSGIRNIEKSVSLYFYKKSFNAASFDPEAYRLKAIYGESGSGKTGIILGAHILRNLILYPDYLVNPETQQFISDVVNKNTDQIDLECEYYYRSDSRSNIYKYCVSIARTEAGSFDISGEQLFVRSAGYASSKYNEISLESDSDADGPDHESHKKTLQLLASSLVTTFDDAGISTASKPDHSAFNDRIKILERFLKVFRPNLQCIEFDNKEGSELSYNSLVINYGDYNISVEHESTCTRRLIHLYDYLCMAAEGKIVFIDDLDENMNEVYLFKIIKFLALYGKGQLCFTVHNTSLMSLLRNYRNSIDFLSSDNIVTPWRKKGNLAPDSMYRNGMVNHIPFNIEAEDLLGILG